MFSTTSLSDRKRSCRGCKSMRAEEAVLRRIDFGRAAQEETCGKGLGGKREGGKCNLYGCVQVRAAYREMVVAGTLKMFFLLPSYGEKLLSFDPLFPMKTRMRKENMYLSSSGDFS